MRENRSIEDLLDARQARGDYIDPATGLLFCGKCHTPKEALAKPGESFFGRDRHPVMCSCRRRWVEEQEARETEQKHRCHVRRLRERCFEDLPLARSWRFEDGELAWHPGLERCRSYAERFDRVEGEGLVIFGGVGTGKSRAAACIANVLLERELSVRMIGTGRLVSRLQGLRGDEREDYVRHLLRAELLILDDLGTQRDTGYGMEQIFDVVDRRVQTGRPMIVTTNLSLSRLRDPEDLREQRINDRVLEVCAPLHFDCPGHRRANAAARLSRTAVLLGGCPDRPENRAGIGSAG